MPLSLLYGVNAGQLEGYCLIPPLFFSHTFLDHDLVNILLWFVLQQVPVSKLMMLVAAKWREFTARGQEDEEEEEEGGDDDEQEPEPEPVQVKKYIIVQIV